MKRRVRKIANFFAFNLLFFALYLNFIHKDKQDAIGVMPIATTQQPAAFSGTTASVHKAEQSVATKEENTDQTQIKN